MNAEVALEDAQDSKSALPFWRLPSVVSWNHGARVRTADKALLSPASSVVEQADGERPPVGTASRATSQDLTAKLNAFKQRKHKIVFSQSPSVRAGDGESEKVESTAQTAAAESTAQTAGKSSADLGASSGLGTAEDGLEGAERGAENDHQLKPLRLKVRHWEPRRERGKFKEMLEKPVQLRPEKRNPGLCTSIVRGLMTPDVRAHVLTVQKRIVSFLLSSTFTDTEWERNLLLDDVMPYLQDYSRKRMFEIKLVEMRWGIRKDASDDHKTSDICMAELERCQRESQGYFYVFIGAQKYGYRPFPAKIPKPIYDMLYEASKYAPTTLCESMIIDGKKKFQSHKWLLDQHFRLDTNNVPGPHDNDDGIPGLTWEDVGSERPGTGTEITCDALAQALQQRLEFNEDELDTFQVSALCNECFIKSGEKYFKPVVAVSDALGGEGGEAGEEAEELDEWQGPPGAVYVLRSASEFPGIWWPRFEKIQQVLRYAAKHVWKDLSQEGEEGPEQRGGTNHDILTSTSHPVRDPMSKAFIKKFFISVTEEEFSRGMLWRSEKEQREKTMVLRRTFQDLDQRVDESGIEKFIDIANRKVDAEAQLLLSQQLAMVPDHVRLIEYLPVEWVPKIGLDPENKPAHREYLRKFLDDFCVAMMKSIDAAAERLAVEPEPIVDEATQHLRFALKRGMAFKATKSTQGVEAVIAAYLVSVASSYKDVDSSSMRFDISKPLVVYGVSGAGKTYLISKIISDFLDKSADNDTGRVVVVRFLGTTPFASNALNLLTSICEQLKRAYDKHRSVVPSDFIELRDFFITAVTTWPSENAPLTLFIDSVDQLDDSNAGRRLDWLPMSDMPSCLRIVISTLPDPIRYKTKFPVEFQCCSILERNLGRGNMVQVPAISEHRDVLSHLLKRQGRRLTRTQTEEIAKYFDGNVITPLWLTIVAQTASSWRSYDELRYNSFLLFYLSTVSRIREGKGILHYLDRSLTTFDASGSWKAQSSLPFVNSLLLCSVALQRIMASR